MKFFLCILYLFIAIYSCTNFKKDKTSKNDNILEQTSTDNNYYIHSYSNSTAYILKIDSTSNFIKYSPKIKASRSKNPFMDSILIDQDMANCLKKMYYFDYEKHKSIYWDSLSNGVVRKILFPKNGKLEEKIKIIGEPKNDSILFIKQIIDKVIFEIEEGSNR